MKLIAFMMAGACLILTVAAHAETLLMSYEEYMDRCMDTYGEDRVTEKVCESQYRALEKKEQELMAQVAEDQAWPEGESQADMVSSIER